MTRKDYERLAEALGEAFAAADAYVSLRQQVTRYVCQALAADNPRFDRERFLDRIGDVEAKFRR